MILKPKKSGKYSRQQIYDWFLENRIGGKPLWFTSYKLDQKLHERLVSYLGEEFTTGDLFVFLQPERSKCPQCDKIRQSKYLDDVTFAKGFVTKWCSRTCAQNAPELREKIKATHLRVRGVEFPLQDPRILGKRRKTNIKRYGGKATFASEGLAEKAHRTMEFLYGTRHFSQTVDWYQKVSETSQRNWGTLWISQSSEIHEKVKRSSFQRKTVEINGKVHVVQGYEPMVLRYLEGKIRKLITDSTKLPHLWYKYKGKTKRYHPDAFFKSYSGKKYLLEVKSNYTVTLHRKKNRKKFRSAIKWCQENDATFLLGIGYSSGTVEIFKLKTLAMADLEFLPIDGE